MTRNESYRIVEISVQEASGKVPLVVGANHSNIKDAIEFGQFASNMKVDALLVRPPYYWGVPSEEMVLRHYKEIACRVDTGIVIYNRCLSNIVDLPLATIQKLAAIDKIVAIKDGTSDFRKFDHTVKAMQGKLSCINGFGELYEPYTLLMGSDGFVSCAANFIPKIALKLFEYAKMGQFEKAEKIHRQLLPLMDILFSGTYGQFIEISKVAMQKNGLAGGPVRDPLPKAGEEKKTAVIRFIEQVEKLHDL